MTGPFRSPVLALPLVLITTSVFPQVETHLDTLARAEALSDSVDYEAGASLLAPYVAAHPDLVSAWLLLAEFRYWSGDTQAAQAAYTAGIERHPDDAGLRLSYARFLMDLGEASRVREVLQDVEGAEAETLLGTAAWWRGDLAAAARHFRSSLREDPNQEDARDALLSIESETRPWLRIETGFGSDTQPLTFASGKVATGIFATPLQALYLESALTRYAADNGSLQSTQLSAGYRAYWVAVRLETDVVAGMHQRQDNVETIGRATAAIRLPYSLRLSGSIERLPYYHTEASIAEPFMMSAAGPTLSLDRSGWLGETAFRRERYPDSNVKHVAYGWLTAPVVNSERLTLMLGYAFSYQNSTENRFVPVLISVPSPGRPPEWVGRYVPYYTPLDWHTHSAAGSLSLRLRKGTNITANGSFAVEGREEAPFIYEAGTGSMPLVGLYSHRIHPWNVRVGLSIEVSSSALVKFQGNYTSTTWYEAANAEISLQVRL